MKKLEEVTIGERLRRLRERVQMTQADVEEAAGIAVSVISRYERDVITPGWAQIEKILKALNATPCELFEDYCLELNKNDTQNTFEVEYFGRRPDAGKDAETPDLTLRFRKSSQLVDLLKIAAVDKRYALVRASTDSMIPDIYPNDLMLSDREMKLKTGHVVAGYLGGEPTIGRVIRHAGQLLLVRSNRRYSVVQFDKNYWDHRGTIVYVLRNLSERQMGGGFVDEGSDVIGLGGLP